MSMKAYVYAFLFLPMIALAQNSPSGKFLDVEGSVRLQNNDGNVVASTDRNTKREITEGSPFFEGETLVTGDDSSALLLFLEGNNEVRVGPNTKLVIQRAPSDPRMKRGTNLFLDSGKVDSKVKQKYSGKGSDEFAIETRAIVAGVRGTEFSVQQEEEISTVIVQSGQVEVRSKSSGDRKLLKAGDRISNKNWSLKPANTSATNINSINVE